MGFASLPAQGLFIPILHARMHFALLSGPPVLTQAPIMMPNDIDSSVLSLGFLL